MHVFAFAALLIWFGAFHVEAVHELDADLLWLGTRSDGASVAILTEIVRLIQPAVYATLCAAVLAWAWRQRGLRDALSVGVLVLGANITTQLLKASLAVPRPHDAPVDQIVAASWPSGHSTAAASLAFAAYLLEPRTKWPGVTLAVWMGAAVVADGWHYPSDALGGFAVAGAWAAGVASVLLRRPLLAATGARRRRWLRATG